MVGGMGSLGPRLSGGWKLTWDSRPGRIYAVDMTTDFTQWAELIGSIASQGVATSFTLSTQSHQLAAARAFFKVRELSSPQDQIRRSSAHHGLDREESAML